VAAFNQRGWLVIVVTNQSGVGRGYYTEDAMHANCTPTLREDLAEAGGTSTPSTTLPTTP